LQKALVEIDRKRTRLARIGCTHIPDGRALGRASRHRTPRIAEPSGLCVHASRPTHAYCCGPGVLQGQPPSGPTSRQVNRGMRAHQAIRARISPWAGRIAMRQSGKSRISQGLRAYACSISPPRLARAPISPTAGRSAGPAAIGSCVSQGLRAYACAPRCPCTHIAVGRSNRHAAAMRTPRFAGSSGICVHTAQSLHAYRRGPGTFKLPWKRS